MALLTLAEAKSVLELTGTTKYDADVQTYVDALTPVIERHTGPIEQRTVTETVNAYGPLLALTQVPAVSLTSLTPVHTGGTALDVAALALDGDTGVIRRLDGGVFAGGPWVAVYTAGRGLVRANIGVASRMLLQHWWRTRYGAARGNPGGGEDYSVNEPVVGFGYAIPNRVLEILEPDKAVPGIA
ncbi:hypothetical protein R1T08_24145 [Streptomyces sp. SBC-4]|nr:hypothetical protein [Streptomyces sp. SBC-4]MDV5147182.1 hypothetical protein [Streptomyces sp. SBC-4]